MAKQSREATLAKSGFGIGLYMTITDRASPRLAMLKEGLRSAIATAVNRAAFTVRKELRTKITKSIDRPTQFTLNGVAVEQASAENLTARVGPNAAVAAAWNRMMRPNVYGGTRGLKAFEARLGGLIAGYKIVPGKKAPLDAYGNVKRGELLKMTRAISSGSVTAKIGKSSKSRAWTYQVVLPNSGVKLPPGVYKNVGGQRELWLLFVSNETYQKRIDWYGTAQQVVNQVGTKFCVQEIRKLWDAGKRLPPRITFRKLA